MIAALRAAWIEFRRVRTLAGWEPGEVFVWPVVMGLGTMEEIAPGLGLRIVDIDRYPAMGRDGEFTRWRLRLDRQRDPNGIHGWRYLAGVATCVSHDDVRDVVVLEGVGR